MQNNIDIKTIDFNIYEFSILRLNIQINDLSIHHWIFNNKIQSIKPAKFLFKNPETDSNFLNQD